MKKIISIILLACILLQATPAFAANAEGTVSITLDKQTATVGDVIEATVTLENMDVSIMALPVHFNPSVVKIVNNNGAVVGSGLKTAADFRNGRAGVIPGQAINGAVDAQGNSLYWNGAIFENPQYPYLDNDRGLYKMMFSNTESKMIVNETLITLRFAVVGVGNSDIRIATKDDNEHDRTSPGGVTYYGVDETPHFPEMKGANITATAGGTPPPLDPGTSSGGNVGSGLPPTVEVTPDVTSDTLTYEVPEKLIENSLARAADETKNSLNISVNAGANVNTFVIKVPVPSVRKAQAAAVFSFLFDTPIGIIGFNNLPILVQAQDDSEFVILTLKSNLDCTIAIDDKVIQGCILGFHTEEIGAVAYSSNQAVMKSSFDGENLIFNAKQNGTYTVQVKDLNFPDLAKTHWSYGYVQSLVAKNVINGMEDGTFLPEYNVTREQFAKMLVEALEIYDASATCDFTDLDTSHWAYTYVASAVKAGVIMGYDDGTFGVGRNITRQEMAVMVSRCDVNFPTLIPAIAFTDSGDIADWARAAVTQMQRATIISGFEDNSFKPQENATRAQAAKIIYGILGIID